MITYRQSGDTVWINDIGHTAASVQARYDIAFPPGIVHRSYGIIAPEVEEWSDGRSALPQPAATLPYAAICADVELFTRINPEPEATEPDPLQEIIRQAREDAAAAGIVVDYGLLPEHTVRLWCTGESDFWNYNGLLGLLESAERQGLTEPAPYPVDTMDGPALFNRATAIFILGRYCEAAYRLYADVIILQSLQRAAARR